MALPALKTMAPLRHAAKFDPFLSLDCAPTPSTLAQCKERKGSNFAIWQPWAAALHRFLPSLRCLSSRLIYDPSLSERQISREIHLSRSRRGAEEGVFHRAKRRKPRNEGLEIPGGEEFIVLPPKPTLFRTKTLLHIQNVLIFDFTTALMTIKYFNGRCLLCHYLSDYIQQR